MRRLLFLDPRDRPLEIIAEGARLLRWASADGEHDERGDRIEPILRQELDQRAGGKLLPAHPDRRDRDAKPRRRTGDEPRARAGPDAGIDGLGLGRGPQAGNPALLAEVGGTADEIVMGEIGEARRGLAAARYEGAATKRRLALASFRVTKLESGNSPSLSARSAPSAMRFSYRSDIIRSILSCGWRATNAGMSGTIRRAP